MIFGGNPEIVLTESPDAKRERLRQLTADYLLKDIFAQVDVNRDRLHDLLRLIAFQVGSELSLNELAASVRIDVKTVDRYLGFHLFHKIIGQLRADDAICGSLDEEQGRSLARKKMHELRPRVGQIGLY
jgi:predicted AAA+ superfamily ATPase